MVGGYRPDGANGVDALLVGYYEGKELRFAGKVRAGMVPHTRRELARSSSRCVLRVVRSPTCPTQTPADGAAE